jgi:ABC-type transport system substrate-binding protein
MYQSPFQPTTSVLTFGWQGADHFKDERVRQAMSMSIDRDLDIDVRYNKEKFEAQGLPVQTLWNSHLGARDAYVKGGWFLDPQGKDFGPNAKYFNHDVAEAKKLLAAAGLPNGFEMKFYYPNAPQFNRKAVAEPMVFYFQEIGVRVVDAGQTDYTQGYIPLNRDASGAYDGLGYHSVTGTIPSVVDPTSALVAEHLPSSGVTFHGYSVGGGGGKTGDPALISILDKARLEKDVNARKKLTLDAQRHLGKAQWNMLESGGASGFWLAWPAVQNFVVWQSSCAQWEKYQIWLDQTKAPFV